MPAAAASECDGALARLESADKRTLVVSAYGSGRWMERTDRGRLPYVVHVWKGEEGAAARHLTFTEIPGTSGPNWGSVSDLRELKAKIVWQRVGQMALPDVLRSTGGPLEGEWTLACRGKPPAPPYTGKLPRFDEYPAGIPYHDHGRVARMKAPRGLHEEIRLRLTDSFSHGAKPDAAGRYIRLTWPCGTTCIGSALMNAATGRVIMLPYMSGWDDVPDGFEPVDVRLNSRLVVLSGARNERGILGRHFYVLQNGRLRHLRSVETDRDFPNKTE